VRAIPHIGKVLQAADPDSGGVATTGGHGPAASLATIEHVLGGPRPALELRTRQAAVGTDVGVLRVEATGVDPANPLAQGLFRLTSGRTRGPRTRSPSTPPWPPRVRGGRPAHPGERDGGDGRHRRGDRPTHGPSCRGCPTSPCGG
jgi:hypothetical protein